MVAVSGASELLNRIETAVSSSPPPRSLIWTLRGGAGAGSFLPCPGSAAAARKKGFNARAGAAREAELTPPRSLFTHSFKCFSDERTLKSPQNSTAWVMASEQIITAPLFLWKWNCDCIHHRITNSPSSSWEFLWVSFAFLVLSSTQCLTIFFVHSSWCRCRETSPSLVIPRHLHHLAVLQFTETLPR
jgi:hypothetical protein